MEYGITDPLKSGRDSTVKALKKLPQLRMFLDEDHNGAVDDEPASCAEWEWGECKTGEHKGAIIMVKNRKYKLGETVNERLPIKIDWENTEDIEHYRGQWAATLQIADPDQVRIYNNIHEGANQVLGKGIEGNLFEIHRDDVFPVHLNGGQAVILWMEAVDYPQENDGSDACVTMQLKFTDLRAKGLAQTTIVQEAQLRIAPWIMAGDLDETKVVFAREPKDDNCIAKKIEKFAKKAGCGFQPVPPKEAKKGFMRDVIKSGYVTGPGKMTERVVLENLDKGAKLTYYTEGKSVKRTLLLDSSIQDDDISLATVPQEFELWPAKWRTSQDNGGNYLVSPSTEEHPWGRIIFGEGIKYVNEYVCNLGDFLCAQRLQEPIILDPTWLRVGHVDEIIAFTPDPYKVLISNSRLAYTLLYGIAWALSKPNPDYSSEYMLTLVCANSRAIEVEIRKDKYRNKYGNDYINLLAEYFGTFEKLKFKLSDNENSGGNFGEYKSDDPPPLGYSGRMIIPEMDGITFNAKDIANLLERSKTKIAETQIFINSMTYQKFIDEGCREILKKELKKGDSDFIDLPVLFEQGVGGAHAITGDSTNMLILAKNKECRCLMAKPFGPVYGQKYVFQEYIQQRLMSDAKIKKDNIVFANNWVDMHLEDGEIHCGTNQLPEPLPDGRREWWLKEPPEIVTRSLSDISRREITREPKLKVEFINPPDDCFIDPSEAEIELVDAVANEELKFKCNILKAGDKIDVKSIISKYRTEGRGEIKTNLKPGAEIATIRRIPKLHIAFKGEPAEGCEVDEILTELTLDNAKADQTVDFWVTDLTLGRQIKVSDVWTKLCSAGPAPDYTIREAAEDVVAEITKKVDLSNGIPPPPPM